MLENYVKTESIKSVATKNKITKLILWLLFWSIAVFLAYWTIYFLTDEEGIFGVIFYFPLFFVLIMILVALGKFLIKYE